jgi:nucleotide-binding universal stress UspA family protein
MAHLDYSWRGGSTRTAMVSEKGADMAEILVGVDGSPGSRAALRWSLGVGTELDARVHAVMAWQYPAMAVAPFGPASIRTPEEMDRATQAKLREMVLAEAGDRSGAIVCDVVRGPAALGLVERAAHDSIEALVLGARGLGGFTGLALGSVSQHCVERAPCPVVVLRDGDDGTGAPPRKVLVGLDGSDGSTRALRWALHLAGAVGASLVTATAIAPDAVGWGAERDAEEELRNLSGRAIDSEVPCTTRVVAGDPRWSLERAASEEGADLVVVGNRGLGPLRGLVLGSVAAHLVRHAGIAIATVPGPADESENEDGTGR